MVHLAVVELYTQAELKNKNSVGATLPQAKGCPASQANVQGPRDEESGPTAFTVMTDIIMADVVMAYVVMAYIVMAYIIMAYIVMAYIVTKNRAQTAM